MCFYIVYNEYLKSAHLMQWLQDFFSFDMYAKKCKNIERKFEVNMNWNTVVTNWLFTIKKLNTQTVSELTVASGFA